ncbi:MAG: hypothetical protein OMM_11678, partial [Candidatus Magnetoglobus multicellularis str. Araruama]
DYDNDGDLDILLTGSSSSGYIAKVYRNTGGSFSEDTGFSLTGVYRSSVAFGDYDNDGDLDILLTGYTGSGRIAKVYRNTGGSFSEDTGIYLTGVASSSVAFGDFDNDNDLDILLTGNSDNGYIARIYRNNTETPNTAPSAPSHLTTIVSNDTVQLSWSAASDAETLSSSGLNYNLCVGASPYTCDILSPMSLPLSNGYRQIPARGMIQGLTATINNLPDGTYYWRVQAIDTAFTGSEFSAEASFVIGSPDISSIASQSTVENLTVTSISFCITSTNTSPCSLDLTISASNETLIPSQNISYVCNNNQYTLTIIPANNQTGSSSIFIVAKDSAGLTSSTSFEFIVHNVNYGAINNGSFETESLEGWTIVDLSDPFIPLTFTNQPTNAAHGWGPFFQIAPTDGDRAAVHGFDGSAGIIKMYQYVYIPEDGTILSFDYRAGWNMTLGGGTKYRIFDINIESPNGTLLQNKNFLSADPSVINYDTGLMTDSLSLAEFAQSIIKISFDFIVPENYSGPGLFQLDNLKLNVTPKIDIIPDQTINEGTATNPISILITDIDSAPCNLTLTFNSSNKNLIPISNISYACNDGNYTISVVPVSQQTGISTISLTCTDASGLTTSTSFNFTVNGAPALSSIENQQTVIDFPISIPFQLTDIEGGHMRISVSSSLTSLVMPENISFTGTNITSDGQNYTIHATASMPENITMIIQPVSGQSGDTMLTITIDDHGTFVQKAFAYSVLSPFTESENISLSGVYRSSVAFADYDNDGDLDIVLSGMSDS